MSLSIFCLEIGESLEPQKLAEICLRWSPQLSLGQRAVFMEVSRCRRLHSEQSLRQRIMILSRRLRTSIRLGQGPTLARARGQIYFLNQDYLSWPLKALRVFADPLWLSARTEKIEEALGLLGLKSVEDFMNLPASTLNSRFGSLALQLRMNIEQNRDPVWPQWRFLEKIIESQEVDESFAVRSLEPLLFILRPLLERAFLRLKGRGEKVLQAQMILRTEKLSFIKENKRKIYFEFAYPQGRAAAVFGLMQERLHRELQRNPLESALVGIEVQFLKTIKSEAGQADFFHKKEQEEESLQELTLRLQDRLGTQGVFQVELIPSYFPEGSWRRVPVKASLPQSQSTYEALPRRPLKMFSEPQKVFLRGDSLFFRNKKWQIRFTANPERISTNWWKNERERLYKTLETAEGEQLWVFTRQGQQDLFLHGIFT